MTVYKLGALVPRIGKGTFVAPNATVIGDVVLGDSSSVWFGTVIRGDVMPIRIGARTNVQDNSVVHVTAGTASTTIGDDVTIGHSAVIHGCTIGNHCLVGMGSIVLDGAILEDECFIAAGSIVSPNTRIAARTLALGRPARFVKKLAEADLAALRSASEHYVEYARVFGEQLTKLESELL